MSLEDALRQQRKIVEEAGRRARVLALCHEFEARLRDAVGVEMTARVSSADVVLLVPLSVAEEDKAGNCVFRRHEEVVPLELTASPDAGGVVSAARDVGQTVAAGLEGLVDLGKAEAAEMADAVVDGGREAMAGAEKPAGLRTGPMDDAEVARARALIAEGHDSHHIAAELGRKHTGALVMRLNQLARDLPGPEAPEARADGTEPPLARDVDPARSITWDYLQDRVLGQRALDNEVNLSTWEGLADDLELIERLSRGDRLGMIAAELGLDSAFLKARFKALLPVADVESQARMCRVIRRILQAREVAVDA